MYARKTLEAQLNLLAEQPESYHLFLLDEPTANFDTTNAEWFENTYLPTLRKQENALAFIETQDRALLQRGKESDIEALAIGPA